MNRIAALLLAAILVVIAGIQGLNPLTAQSSSVAQSASDAREALAIARQQQRNARDRAERLEAETERALEASSKAQVEAAKLAARVQQAEAGVAAAQAELALVESESAALSRDLARRRQPLAQLTGALETMSRRPLALAALQPGSLRDVVHTRAVLSSAVPVVRQRTAALRGDLDRARALGKERRDALASQRASEERLEARRKDMIALAEQEQVRATQAAGGASREAARAFELAENARDLDALVAGLEQDAVVRSRLAALDGPIVRPSDPRQAAAPSAARPSASQAGLGQYILPVTGRVIRGFGEDTPAGTRSAGIAMQTRPGAQVVAPGAGRVAFAGRYEGYGRIVILEHDGGWTSLITGLARLSVQTNQSVTAGSPLGLAGSARPEIMLELRKSGDPVNPLDQLR